MAGWPICLEYPLPIASTQGILSSLGILVYDGALIWVLSHLIRKCRPWLTFWVALVFVSPTPVAVAAWIAEGRAPWTMFSLSQQSWAFMFGDVALAALLGVCAKAWSGLPLMAAARYRRPGWLARSVMIGAVLAALFHAHEGTVYDILRYYSYPKLIHDLVSYVVLASMVIYAAWPVLRFGQRKSAGHKRMPARLLVLLLLAVWAGGGVQDARHSLNPAYLHRPHPSVAEYSGYTDRHDPIAARVCQIDRR
jgi:hypothetical protein